MRNIKDDGLIASVNLPAAGANAVTPALSVGTGPHLEVVEVLVEIPALAGVSDSKALTVTLEHGDTLTGSFTTVTTLGSQVLTGAGGTGVSALSWQFRLPSDVKACIRAKAALESAGGTITDDEITLTVLN